MKKTNLIKYQHGNDKGLMHYVVYNGDVVILSKYDSKKVSFIEKNGSLDITFDIENGELETVKVEVVTDSEYVMAVYNYMLEVSNAYFYDGTEGICAIKILK